MKWLIGSLKLLAVAAVVIWSIGPVVLIVLSSFKFDRDIFAVHQNLFFTPTLDNYVNLWTNWGIFFKGMINSVIITLGALVLSAVVCLLAGYAYSRYRSSVLSASAFFLIALRIVPPIVVTLPLFPIVNVLGLSDTHIVLIVLSAAFFASLGTLMMKAFIDQIPREIDEAAYIDGASRLQILWHIIFPLAMPGMVAVAVFVVVFAWNEYTFAFIFTTRNASTAPMVIAQIMGALDGVEWGVLFAASTVQLLPILIFIIVAQRRLVAGMMVGSTKG
jgi:multiple sugar transport system permease protein